MEIGLTLADPRLLTMGISESECCNTLPSGIEVLFWYLFCDRRTGGRS